VTSRLLADALVAFHALFVAFVVAGGLLVLWKPRLAWLHLPAALWGAWTEFTGTICPLTPLENALRRAAGEAGYAGGFIEHYVVPALYPEGLTPRMQVGFGIAVVAINAVLYGFAWRRARICATIPVGCRHEGSARTSRGQRPATTAPSAPEGDST
jgi:hypothetical protein